MADTPQKLVTGNRLRDGVPVYYAGAGGWSPRIGEARLVDDQDGEALLAEAQAGPAPHPAVAPELIEALIEGGGVVPVTLREKIRAFGPTVPFGG